MCEQGRSWPEARIEFGSRPELTWPGQAAPVPYSTYTIEWLAWERWSLVEGGGDEWVATPTHWQLLQAEQGGCLHRAVGRQNFAG